MRFTGQLRLRAAVLYGGSPKYPQLAALRQGVDIVIATPGRINDFLEAKSLTVVPA